jgi:hypothetical protein
MNPTFNDKLIAYLALLSGLSISAVAVYYSVIGLTAIFAAAAIPIIIMGITLEVSKLVATVWLKQNWKIAPLSIKTYLIIAVGILMLITSMGIFGFLSKAHLDQYAPAGEITAQLSAIDEKIKIQKDNIDGAKRALQQMDSQVDQLLGRTDTERGAERAVQVRKQQARERDMLQKEIVAAQQVISKLSNERSPIAGQLRKVEAEVGPIKYIAPFFYGETDQTILEKAVAWMIIILIVVFDPLAVVLLLASQFSFQHFRDKLIVSPDPDKEPAVTETTDKFNINDHPYLFEPIPRLVPGIDPSGPVVYKPDQPPMHKTYVQNEEQQKSNLWSTARENSISQDYYHKKIQEKKEQGLL